MRLKLQISSGKLKMKAVTLIDLVIVITIVGILAGVSSMYIKETIDLWRFLNFRSEVVSQGRMSLMRMEREIRQMARRTVLFEPILAAEASRIQFTSIDLTGDGNYDTVEFFRNAASELRRKINNNPTTGDILASNVIGLTFTYFNSSNSSLPVPVADKSQIYRIAVNMQIRSGTQTKSLDAQIFPRNL